MNSELKVLYLLPTLLLLILNPVQAETHDAMTSHAGMEMHEHHSMAAAFGSYFHAREASGTSWQPDSSPMEGWHFSYDDWSLMAHGFVLGAYDRQGGKRGDEKLFSASMGMLMATRPLGPGRLGLRAMLSLDPLMGKRGYPQLLQTGETADGVEHLIDRQHPHDLFMELAVTYSLPLSDTSSLFFYGGLPGEPALGPPAFMHRVSGVDFPDSPITHHWLDSTHITEGVLTAGYVFERMKIEGSVFNGREPDQRRYDIETRRLDSWSGRFSFNPTDNWSAQISFANIDSPEQLAPEIGTKRTTASVTYNLPFDGNNWATTFAWGHNDNSPGDSLDAYLLESAYRIGDTHTIFGRFENVEKDELFHEESENAGRAFRVSRLGVGYRYDFPAIGHLKLGIGTEGIFHILPKSLESSYGDTPFSFFIFVQGKII